MTTNDFPPRLVLQQLIQGFQVPQCIYVVARLGIADLLTAVDLFTEGKTHSFALTPLGVYLQSGVPGSLRTMALAYGEKPFWPVGGPCSTASKRANQLLSMSSASKRSTIMRSIP